MDESSVTRPSPPSTRAIRADEAFCAQASRGPAVRPGAHT